MAAHSGTLDGAATVGGARHALAARLSAAGCVAADAEARWLVEEACALDPGGARLAVRRELTAIERTRLEAMAARRCAGEPLQYVVGWAPFGRLRLEVGPGVFIPRPETEGLAERAAGHLRRAAPAPGGPGPIAVDLCTGSGAIACFLADAVPGSQVYATEIEPAATAWAHRNVAGRAVTVLAGDLDDPLPVELEGRVDVLTANVPYVPTPAIATLPRDVRAHEPRAALDGGTDGLDVLREVARRAPCWLRPGGWLLAEIGEGQGAPAMELLAAAGFARTVVYPDLCDRERVVEARRS